MPEILDIIDDNDNVIGQATYEECHGNNKLRHRAVNVLVINSSNEALLQRRSDRKLIGGLKWDLSATGHVRSGETYDEAAKREAKEELGLDLEIELIGKISFRDDFQAETGANFISRLDCDIKNVNFNEDEVIEVKFVKIDELKKLLKENKEIFVHWFKKNFDQIINGV